MVSLFLQSNARPSELTQALKNFSRTENFPGSFTPEAVTEGLATCGKFHLTLEEAKVIIKFMNPRDPKAQLDLKEFNSLFNNKNLKWYLDGTHIDCSIFLHSVMVGIEMQLHHFKDKLAG